MGSSWVGHRRGTGIPAVTGACLPHLHRPGSPRLLPTAGVEAILRPGTMPAPGLSQPAATTHCVSGGWGGGAPPNPVPGPQPQLLDVWPGAYPQPPPVVASGPAG